MVDHEAFDVCRRPVCYTIDDPRGPAGHAACKKKHIEEEGKGKNGLPEGERKGEKYLALGARSRMWLNFNLTFTRCSDGRR
ncbi:BCL-6 corepressor-like isoform X1 [Anopheles sinensis]|uniref:BCL-6 corepressor-like isoform X1 n=1 Tax=Anopheles sinensis TaxID=74873 RepID=A0A084WUD8_ANOSI|nr:BCL-6 corepressor-like isoform X1 [Anopheles sinensis]